MFILSMFTNRGNGYTRRTRKAFESKACREEIGRIGKCISGYEERSVTMRNPRRFDKGDVSPSRQSKQCTSSYQARTRISLLIKLIPLFIFYNPQLWTLLFIIDISFSDELIMINAIQLNSIISNIQMFINRGVV